MTYIENSTAVPAEGDFFSPYVEREIFGPFVNDPGFCAATSPRDDYGDGRTTVCCCLPRGHACAEHVSKDHNGRVLGVWVNSGSRHKRRIFGDQGTYWTAPIAN